MNKDIELLAKTLQEVMPQICKEWNKVKLPLFEELTETPFREYYKDRQTQEKTKNVSPILDKVTERFLRKRLDNFFVTEGKGFDYTLNNTEIEWKNSLSDSDSWTGNGYKKTNWHVLCKFITNEDGIVEKYFACIVPYDMVESNWSDTGNSNFSSLKLLKSDLDNVIEVSGNFKQSVKYLQPQYVSLG